jgi:xylose isomerase
MRTYLILRERAQQWRADSEIQALLASVGGGHDAPALSAYSLRHRDDLLSATFDRAALSASGLAYERLDQLTMDLLLGAR